MLPLKVFIPHPRSPSLKLSPRSASQGIAAAGRQPAGHPTQASGRVQWEQSEPLVVRPGDVNRAITEAALTPIALAVRSLSQTRLPELSVHALFSRIYAGSSVLNRMFKAFTASENAIAK